MVAFCPNVIFHKLSLKSYMATSKSYNCQHNMLIHTVNNVPNSILKNILPILRAAQQSSFTVASLAYQACPTHAL